MDNALNSWGQVQTGYVSGTMRSMLPQHRKKERERERDEGVLRTAIYQGVKS